MTSRDALPLVSVVMSNFNGAAYLEAAVTSVLAQSYGALEVIVADDASTDDSVTILNRLAEDDPRLKTVALTENKGPAGARNAAIEAAQGDWLAIVDADDLVHPDRIARLMNHAKSHDADLIADDLVSFGAPETAGQTLLCDHVDDATIRVTPSAFFRSDTAGSGFASFGYLKPIIRRSVLGDMRYDETLRFGDDFDLYGRLLLSGACFMAVADPMYLYRRHAHSISHRLSVTALERLIAAHDNATTADTELHQILAERRAGLVRALRYQRFVDAVKARKIWAACGHLLRHPELLKELRASLAERRARGRSRAPSGAQPGDAQTVILGQGDASGAVKAPPDAIWISDTHAESITRLARLATRGPLDIIAIGSAGLNTLGYAPIWRSAQLYLDAKTAQRTPVPQKARVEILPKA